jgi:hypothetical protein
VPSQVPTQAVPVPAHFVRLPRGSPVTATQVPFWSFSPQDSQVPEQTLSQQTPSTQWVVVQSLSWLQADPCPALVSPPSPAPSVRPSVGPSVGARSLAVSPMRPSLASPPVPPSGQLGDVDFAIASVAGPTV